MSRKKNYTREELVKKIQRMRGLMAVLRPSMLKTAKKRAGTELFLNTEEGSVRVLTYNAEDPRTLPLFVNIHGSGFVLGNAEMDDPFMMNVAAGAGVKIISVDYPLAPEYPFPAAVNQCYAVVRYAKDHPQEFGIDGERIAVGGHSAGGNFTAAIALMEHGRRTLGIKCLILDYPPLDIYTDPYLKPRGSIPPGMAALFDSCYCINREDRKNPLMSPLFASAEQLQSFPPTLIMTAAGDSLCAEGERFKDMLEAAGVDVTFRRFNAAHGFNLGRGPLAAESWQMQIDHLKRYL